MTNPAFPIGFIVEKEEYEEDFVSWPWHRFDGEGAEMLMEDCADEDAFHDALQSIWRGTGDKLPPKWKFHPVKWHDHFDNIDFIGILVKEEK